MFFFPQPSDQKVHVYELNNDTLSEKRALAHDGGVMDVSYSPDGAHLAAVDTYRKVYLYKLPEYEVSEHRVLCAEFWCSLLCEDES